MPHPPSPSPTPPCGRRDLLAAGALATAALLRPRAAHAARRWKKIPIATQAWCVRKMMKDDVPGTLKAVAGIGFQGIELENAFGLPGPTWRQHLDAAKLKACGFHQRLDELRGDKLAATIAFNKAIGNENLIVRSLPKETYTSKERLLEVTTELNQIADKVRAAGLRLGYHNHTDDFNKLGDAYWWNVFADETKKKNLILQFDTGNASHKEGVNVIELLARNKGRTVTMHVKPFSKAQPKAFLGEDELDWKAIMTTVESVGGLEWYIIEYEQDEVTPIESLKANLERFRKLRA
jgi:sugar phosphate isomerase/epimerase